MWYMLINWVWLTLSPCQPSLTQIEDGEIHATLDQADGMVSFTENPQNFDSLATVRYLDTQLKEAISLEKKLGSFEKELACDPRYIQRVSTGYGAGSACWK